MLKMHTFNIQIAMFLLSGSSENIKCHNKMMPYVSAPNWVIEVQSLRIVANVSNTDQASILV